MMWEQEGMFVREWPVECPVPVPRRGSYGDDCYPNRMDVKLYYMRCPSSHRCSLCHHDIHLGDPMLADLYWNDECGLYLCGHCGVHHGPVRHVLEARGRFDFDATAVKLVDAAPSLSEPEAVLLGAHSDCGYPRAGALRGEEAWIVLDAGRTVVVNTVAVHNWYHGSYPSSVALRATGSNADPLIRRAAALTVMAAYRFRPGSAFQQLGRDLSRKIAEMVLATPGEQDWVTLLEHDQAALDKWSQWDRHAVTLVQPWRYFRVEFGPPLESKERRLTIGVIQLISAKGGASQFERDGG